MKIENSDSVKSQSVLVYKLHRCVHIVLNISDVTYDEHVQQRGMRLHPTHPFLNPPLMLIVPVWPGILLNVTICSCVARYSVYAEGSARHC